MQSFHMQIFLMIFPCMSLHCKLVPVQYQEYEYGLLKVTQKLENALADISVLFKSLILRATQGMYKNFKIFLCRWSSYLSATGQGSGLL